MGCPYRGIGTIEVVPRYKERLYVYETSRLIHTVGMA